MYLQIEVRRVHCRRCRAVKRERLEFLADNPLYTERFAWYVGRRCRSSSIKDIVEELNLHWHTVKDLEKQYLREQLRRASQPRPNWSVRARYGSAARTAARRAWMSFIDFSGKRKPKSCAWR